MKTTNLKKIALVLPTLHSGGMERVMSVLANYFATKKDLQVHLILYGKPSNIFYKVDSSIIVHRADFKFNDKLRTLETFRRMKYLRSKITEIKPCCVLSFGTLWNRFVLLSLIGLKTPVYISDRGNPLAKTSVIQGFLANILYPKAAGIIAQTSYAKTIYLEKKSNANIKVIGNPIRATQINTIEKREKIIVSVGRLISSKYHDRLINIFSKLNAPDWKLIIVGGDAIKQKNSITLQEQIKSMGLSERVELAGTQKDVESFLLRSKIFAFTSSSEGFPNVIGEALSAGVPVVSYDCIAGPSDMIDDGENGYLVPVFDDELFQQRLQTLIDNEDLREEMERKAKESIKRFSVETIGEKYLNFITSKV